jgi:hypothetical protein
MAKGSGRLRQAFLVCLELAEAHYRGRGPQRRRGHPWVYGWDLYLALLLFRAYLKATYRHTVELYRELFPDRPCPSFQSLHRFAKGIGEEELWGLFERLRERLQPLLPQEEALLLMDSTGLAHRGSGSGGGGEASCGRCEATAASSAWCAITGEGGSWSWRGWRWALPTPRMSAWGSWLWQGQGPKATSWPTPASMPSPCGNWQPRRGLWRTSPSREGESRGTRGGGGR